MKFAVFGKPGCAKCTSTKAKLTHLLTKADLAGSVDVAFVDMDTVEGLAEGAFHDVLDIPTTILYADGERPVARWDGRIPPSTEVKAYLASAPGA